MIKPMNILSLFDGLSGGQIALDRLNIPVNKYYASEIDKYAIQVAKHNYPNTLHVGSVIDLKEEDLLKMDIDMLIGGSPCQGFSVSGKMKGSSTTCGIDVTTLEQYLQLKEDNFEFDGQSYLFWEYVRVWKIIKPKYFFLENVRVTKKWLPMFNEAMGVEPIMINSALVSAQNRVRFYWTNIPNLTQPEDKGILLKDILEEGLITKEFKHPVEIEMNGDIKNIKKGTSGGSGNIPKVIIERPCELREYKQESTCHHAADATDIKGNESIRRVYADTGKGPALTTMQGGHREPKVLIVPEATIKGFTTIEDGDCFDYAVPNSKTRRGRNMKDKSNALLTSNAFMRYEHPTYRKLTPLECERLQTLPEGYTSTVSNSQAYKMIGNGWTIDVITHIFKQLLINPISEKKISSAKRKEPDAEWTAKTIRLNNSVINYEIIDAGYVWVYFAYAPNPREFKKITELFLNITYGMIVEYKTQKPLYFANHSEHIEADIYRWKR